MKKLTKVIAVTLLAVALLPAVKTLSASFTAPYQAVSAAQPVDHNTEQKTQRKEKWVLNGFIIKFFEERVAKKPIVTKYADEELSRMANEFNVDVSKLKTMLVVQELLSMKGETKELSQIKNMKDGEVRKILFEAKTKYYDPLSKEEKTQLEKDYKEWKKNK